MRQITNTENLITIFIFINFVEEQSNEKINFRCSASDGLGMSGFLPECLFRSRDSLGQRATHEVFCVCFMYKPFSLDSFPNLVSPRRYRTSDLQSWCFIVALSQLSYRAYILKVQKSSTKFMNTFLELWISSELWFPNFLTGIETLVLLSLTHYCAYT